ATTNNFTTASSTTAVAASTTYLLFVFRHSVASDGITSITSTNSALNQTWTSITSQTFNTSDYQWAYYLTTPSSVSGTVNLTVNFTKTLGASQATILDLVQLGGNDTTTPVVTGNKKT